MIINPGRELFVHNDVWLYLCNHFSDKGFSSLRGTCKFMFDLFDELFEEKILRFNRPIDTMVKFGLDRFIYNEIVRHTFISRKLYTYWAIIYAIINCNLKVLRWFHICTKSPKRPHPKIAIDVATRPEILNFLVEHYYEDWIIIFPGRSL